MLNIIYTILFILTNIAFGYYFIFHTPTPQKLTNRKKSYITTMVFILVVVILINLIPTEFKSSPYYFSYVSPIALSVVLSLILISSMFLLSEQHKKVFKKIFSSLQGIITALTTFLGIFFITQTLVPIEKIRTVMSLASFAIFLIFIILAIAVNRKLYKK